ACGGRGRGRTTSLLPGIRRRPALIRLALPQVLTLPKGLQERADLVVEEVLILCPIHLFDRDHPSAPTCARSWPSRAAAVKDGALQRHRRLVLDRREHGGMINAQRGRGEHPEMTADLSTRTQTRSAQRAEPLILTHRFR